MPLPPELRGREDGLWPDDPAHIERWLQNLVNGCEAQAYADAIAHQQREFDRYWPIARYSIEEHIADAICGSE